MIWITDKNDPQTSATKQKLVLIYQVLYFTINLDITKNKSILCTEIEILYTLIIRKKSNGKSRPINI